LAGIRVWTRKTDLTYLHALPHQSPGTGTTTAVCAEKSHGFCLWQNYAESGGNPSFFFIFLPGSKSCGKNWKKVEENGK
jgi:hypothetical protein